MQGILENICLVVWDATVVDAEMGLASVLDESSKAGKTVETEVGWE